MSVASSAATRRECALVKMFLEAPIVDDRDGGRPRRNRQGTPQGGVISPLLSRPVRVPAARLMDRTLAEKEKILARTGKLRN